MPRQHAWIEILIGEHASIEEADACHQRASRIFGDQWYDEQRSTILVVPSAVVRMERNIVINQQHPGFRKLLATKPKPVVWDQRLFQ